MSFLSRIFKRKVKNNFNKDNKIELFIGKINNLLSEDKYIAKSDYNHLISEFKDTFDLFNTLKNTDMLSEYCNKNKIDKEHVNNFLMLYKDMLNNTFPTNIDEHNKEFVKRHLQEDKKYLDNVLKDIDTNISLDNQQREAVLTDEDYSLIIAGAGAGKTTTVAAKVKYLVDKKNIDPEDILVISFTNKAVEELKERINDRLKIACKISTFHSVGYEIIKKEENTRKVTDDKRLYYVINEFLKNEVFSNEELVEKIIMFFASYIETPYSGNDISSFFAYLYKEDFTSLKSNLNEYNETFIDKNQRKKVTINNEFLRSREEVQIANFLYVNGIEYEYEPTYPFYILNSKKKLYTPDFVIKQGNNITYLEHFGVTEDRKHSFYSKEELAEYCKNIDRKLQFHKKHETKLITTYSKYNDGRDFLTHLKEKLIAAGYSFHPRDSKEILQKLLMIEENKYISKFVGFICRYINLFKTNGYDITHFAIERNKAKSVRNKIFIDICEQCYLQYQKHLLQDNALDFQDMINDSAKLLNQMKQTGEKLNYKYIFIDEYQDISRQRFDLAKELSSICNAKIIAVGDDWQSIYAFSGSDVTLFTHFSKIMGYGKELKITKTYRNAQEVINIAGGFVQKNEAQIKKELSSPKHIEKPVLIYTYDESPLKVEGKPVKGGRYYNLGKKVEAIIGLILKKNKEEGKDENSSILLIGRFGFDAKNLCFSEDFIYDDKAHKIHCKKYPEAKLTYLTAHSSKGLGSDNVIIINAKNEIYGFPSKIETDPIIKSLTIEDNNIDYAEERRLFYVALTRTKNRIFIATPQSRPSEFILELIKDYPNVALHGEINKNVDINFGSNKKCPCCGYPLQLRYNKNYGLKLWMCTNEPEVCGFLSNDLTGGKLSICKCDKCRNGYLLIKKRLKGEGYFLGCSNYQADGTGCDNMVTPDKYYEYINKPIFYEALNRAPSYKIKLKEEMPLPDLKSKLEETKEVKVEIEKSKEVKQRKKAEVHKITRKQINFEKEGFDIICDNDGNPLTDLELLQHLRELRNKISKEEDKPAYMCISNKGLVSLATYKPLTYSEFIDLPYLGEKTYHAYGLKFIEAIKNFRK